VKLVRLALAIGAAVIASTAVAANNWLAVVDTAGGGHAIGNPAAKIKLTEFVSYTCAKCGDFARQASNAVDLYVATGKVQRDVRHVVRNPVDLTVAMLADCGPAAKFPRNHAALMFSQRKWLPIADRASAGQKARWNSGPGAGRRRAVASDLALYDIMSPRGYERVAIDRCLADDALAKRLTDQSAADDEKWHIESTPGFAIDDTILAGVDSWATLRPQLDARL
jgi:protein-disulfide isomerase